MKGKEKMTIRELYYTLFGKKSDCTEDKDDNTISFNDPRYISLQSDDHGQPIWKKNKLGQAHFLCDIYEGKGDSLYETGYSRSNSSNLQKA